MLRWVLSFFPKEAIERDVQFSSGTNIPSSRDIKSKAISKTFDRILSRWVKRWDNKEITNTLATPRTIRTTIGREIWSKILVEN